MNHENEQHPLVIDHVDLVYLEFQQFFGLEEPATIENLDSNVYFSGDIAELPPDSLTIPVFNFLRMLQLATNTTDENVTSHFAKSVLQMAGYDRKDSNAKGKMKLDPQPMITVQRDIPVRVCGKSKFLAVASPCLVDRDTAMILMPVVTSNPRSTDLSFKDPVPEIVAAAIAAYQYNNTKRCNTAKLDLPPLETMCIPCVSIVGTCPVFYKVWITHNICIDILEMDSEDAGKRERERMTVEWCAPPGNLSTGMESLAYRGMALKYFEAFRKVSKAHWETFFF